MGAGGGTQNTWDKLLTYTYSWMASDGHIKEMGSWERTKKSRFYIYNETEITFCLRKSERFEMVAWNAREMPLVIESKLSNLFFSSNFYEKL